MTPMDHARTVERPSRRSFGTAAELALPVGAALLLVTTASASGAYFATSWGWIGVLLCWLTAVGLAVRREVVLSKFELASLATLAGFVGWVAFSLVWSEDVPGTVLEIQRDLVYPVALLTVLLFGRSKGHLGLLAGLTAGITAVCVYSLATRLFPGALLGEFDPTAPISGYRLNDPLGYWNSLAIFAAMGLLLALGFVAESRSAKARALAGAALVILLPTLYFTFSRGGWIALGVGVVGALAVAPRRLRLTTIALAMAPWPVLAVFIGSRFEALTTPGKTVAQVTREGHRLALVIALLAVGAAATAAATRIVEARLPRGPALKRAWAVVLALAVVAVLVSISVEYGSPSTIARKAYRSFKGPGIEVTAGESLQNRLFSLSSSGRLDHWRVAWREWEANPAVGSGAGSYEQWWFQHRPFPGTVRDAHNLYIEVLAELGPLGLALLVGALVLPLVAGLRARREPVVPLAAGAYVAYLVHAGADWDWEVVTVTLTALGIGGGMLLAARPRRPFRLGVPARAVSIAAVVAAGCFAAVGFLGNYPLRRSDDANFENRWSAAVVQAHRAIRWQPWAGAPWLELGLAQGDLGNPAAAQRSFRVAVERDPRDWVSWVELGTVSKGAEQRRAYAQAARLNPLSDRIARRCRQGLVPRGLCPKQSRP